MPIDWNKVESDIDDAIEIAGDQTDEQLASKISSLTRLTDEEISELFPKPADVEKLKRLLKVVKSAEERNNKINAIVNNIEDFGGVIVPLLEKFI